VKCECGGQLLGLPHSDWCDLFKHQFERRTCEGFDGPCRVSGPEVTERTARTFVSGGPDRDLLLCSGCHAAYQAHWDEEWAAYWAACGPLWY
jgi:hypothetical protein